MNRKTALITLSLILMIVLAGCNSGTEASNDKSASSIGNILCPVVGDFLRTSSFSDDHYGIDLAASPGTPLVACFAGTVVDTGEEEDDGVYVEIKTEDGYVVRYSHCDSVTVDEGASVDAGQQVATVGNTGHSTGPHVHMELRDSDGEELDPMDYLQAPE